MKLEKNEVKKDLYKSKNMAKFSHYVNGKLYYIVELMSGVYQFPISTVENKTKFIELLYDASDIDILTEINLIDENEYNYNVSIETMILSEDLGETSFGNKVKGSELIRWISKAIDNDEFIKIGEPNDDNLLIPDYIRKRDQIHFYSRTHYRDAIEKLVWEEED